MLGMAARIALLALALEPVRRPLRSCTGIAETRAPALSAMLRSWRAVPPDRQLALPESRAIVSMDLR